MKKEPRTESMIRICGLYVCLLLSLSQCSQNQSSRSPVHEYQSINKSYYSRLNQVRSDREHEQLNQTRETKLRNLLKRLNEFTPNDQNELIRGKIWFDLGQPDQSLVIFDALIQKKSPLSPEATLEKVRAQLEKKNVSVALSIFQSIEDKYIPNKAYYQIIYQLSLHSKKREDRWLYSNKFLKAARKETSLGPQAGRIYTNLAEIEKERSGPGKAIEFLEKALKQPLNRVAERTIHCYLEALKQVNIPVSEMKFTTWLNSEPLSKRKMKGKVTLIYFWSPGCFPCRQLFPKLQKLFQQHQHPEFLLIGITRLTGRYSDDIHHKISVSQPDEIELIKKLLNRHKTTFPIALVEDSKTLNDLGVLGFPTLFVINSEGNIVDFKLGADNFNKFEQKIKELIK
jgi:thiol-disulfide isomerase/thioredoxin